MTFWKCQAELGNDTALAANRAVNTFHFESNGTGTLASQATDVETALRAFYAVVDSQLSENVQAAGGLRIKIYDHEDAPPRVPIRDTVGDLTTGTTALPNEVAICISYYKSAASGDNRRRTRGRIYFGPLIAGTMEDVTGDTHVTSAVRTLLADAAHDNLMAFTGATSGSNFVWSVFSRSDALGLAVGAPGPSTEPTYTFAELSAGYHAVNNVYVDDAFDSQRRRGAQATARTAGA